MILATLAGIRATTRNVNLHVSCLNLRIRRWELHHMNRLVALFTKIKVRMPNSLILKGDCRVWCEVDWFWKVFWAFLGLILVLEAEIWPESRSFNAASAHMGLEGSFYAKYVFFSPERVEFPPTFWLRVFLRKLCIRRVDGPFQGHFGRFILQQPTGAAITSGSDQWPVLHGDCREL